MIDGYSKIEDIKRRLYERNDSVSKRKREGVIHEVDHKVPTDWNEENQSIDNFKMKKPKTSIFKKFFVFSLIFFIGASLFGAYMFFSNKSSVSNENIDITILGNSFAKGGEELPLQIEIVNRNKSNLELVNLIVEYPKSANDSNAEMIRLPYDNIGTIKSGETVIRNTKVILYGTENSIRNIRVSLEYHPEGSNAIFSKDKEFPVTISLAPLSISVEAPENIVSDQTFSFKVNTFLNTSLPEDNVSIKLTYPNNFIFEEAVPSPSFGDSIWDISSIKLGESLPITIKGRLIGQDKEEQTFHVYAGVRDPINHSTMGVVYNSLLHTTTISKPFLEANIFVNNKDSLEYSVSGDSFVEADIRWVNNLPYSISDVEIVANISGNAFDRSSISPNGGYFDSLNNRIIWNKNTISDLSSIESGEQGYLSFKFKTLSYVGTSNGDKDPSVVLTVDVRGKQPLDGAIFNEISNSSKKVVKILSDFQIAPSVSYLSGSNPPKAETETSYTINWSLSNSINTISKAQAKTVLPFYVDWVSANPGEKVYYDEFTREVTWDIGTVRPNTGIDSSREASFVVSVKPSISQVNSYLQLTKEILLSGIDSFSNTEIKSNRSYVSTSFLAGSGQVVE
jgi:hypothetical protein